MRLVTRLAATDDLAVEDLRIVERTRAWSPPEPALGHRLVFVRRGAFGLRLRGRESTVDPVSAFVARPGDEQSIAHRPGREDVCTVLALGPRLAAELLSGPAALRPLRTSGRVDLAQRALLARARQGADAFELTERAVRLTDALLAASAPVPAGAGSPARRRVAEAAREVLVADPAFTGLDRLARVLGVSRSHLSRVFREETGETLSGFRHRVRVRAALDRLAEGEPDLAGLAADLGFADHAHLTRAVRAEAGEVPSRVRRLLAGEHISSSRGTARRARSSGDHPHLERPHLR